MHCHCLCRPSDECAARSALTLGPVTPFLFAIDRILRYTRKSDDGRTSIGRPATCRIGGLLGDIMPFVRVRMKHVKVRKLAYCQLLFSTYVSLPLSLAMCISRSHTYVLRRSHYSPFSGRLLVPSSFSLSLFVTRRICVAAVRSH